MNTANNEYNMETDNGEKRMAQLGDRNITKGYGRIPEFNGDTGVTGKHGITDDNTAAIDIETNVDIGDETEFETNYEEYDIADYEKLKGMLKDHYIDKSQRKQCHGCGKKFSLTRRQRHCRRCGEVFCIPCVKNKLKLNRLARPDPNGKQRKVCKTCYHEDSLELGFSRSQTSEFVTERKFAKYSRIVNNRVNSLTTTFWPDQIDRKQECRRLMKGFEQSVDRFGTSKTIQEVKVLMKTPAWQKSRYWEVEIHATKCRACNEEKGVRKSSGNCRICGLALCKKCSYQELLLYMYGGERTRQVRLAIINTRGCPLTEPNISLLLYTCKTCKDFIVEQQASDSLWFIDKPKTFQEELVRFNEKLVPLCEQINTLRIKIEDLLDETEVDDLSDKNRNLVKTYINKLKEQLNELDLKFKTLKSFAAQVESNGERIFLKNYTKGKYDFLMENKWKCRVLSNKMETCQNASKQNNV